MDWPKPTPPDWAISAGLPSPAEGEGFIEYVSRLGLDARGLTRNLDERTADLANIRLASMLQEELPEEFRLHVQGLVSEHVPEDRRYWLDRYQI